MHGTDGVKFSAEARNITDVVALKGALLHVDCNRTGDEHEA